MATRQVLLEGRADVRSDLRWLALVARATAGRLRGSRRTLLAAGAHVHPAALRLAEGELAVLDHRHEHWADSLERVASESVSWPLEGDGTARLRGVRDAHAALLRAQRRRVAAAITATDWQSPSYLDAGRSRAGRLTGRIEAHRSDYRRDRHHDAAAYEREHLRRHLPGLGPPATALMTSCGMAAVTTVLAWLEEEGGLAGGAAAGHGVYHETRELLDRALGRPATPVDETSTARLRAATESARTVVVDSVGNERGVPVPDLGALMRCMSARSGDSWLVVDSTGAGPLESPLRSLPARLGDLRVVVVESLTKYAQLGLDATTAGMITAVGAGVERLADHRERLGTNVSDVAVHALPWPDPAVLRPRLDRLERNAVLLAERLHRACGPTVRVSHPALRHHHAHGRRMEFRGGFLTIDLCRSAPDGEGEAFVRRAVARARAGGAELAAGTSFGLDVTRVYAPRLAEGQEARFVRVSAGTEDRLALELVLDALADAARQLRRRPRRRAGHVPINVATGVRK